MWRRVTSLSPVISTSKPASLDQAASGFKIWRSSFSTETPTMVKDGTTSFKERNPFITFVLGGPGSGKGTQCQKIVETFGFKHLSAGELLRREIDSNSEHWSQMLNTIKEGRIVPSEVTVRLIQQEMESSDSNKFLIDGFPRTEENRVAFEQLDLVSFLINLIMISSYVKAHQIGLEPNVVLFFDCPEEEMVKRVLNRNQGRVDDNIDTVKKRLKVFEILNLPVIDYYSKRGKLCKINAVGTEDEIFEKVRPIFSACGYQFLYAFDSNTDSVKLKRYVKTSRHLQPWKILPILYVSQSISLKDYLNSTVTNISQPRGLSFFSVLVVLRVRVHCSRCKKPLKPTCFNKWNKEGAGKLQYLNDQRKTKSALYKVVCF
ncbi:hypothetical protein NC651_034374 [Populus alba x Populus x berolinensis]|nr:hypothetical protein NC651_034374 [Populus alba x Populus x berolinensis]